MEWEVDRKREIVKREPIYALAKTIGQQFDSVIWYAPYEGKTYFYVVQGTWDNYFLRYDDNQTETNKQNR
jgi:hypothetical protein